MYLHAHCVHLILRKTHVLYTHKFRFLFLEGLRAAERNIREKQQEKKQNKMIPKCSITFPAQATLLNHYFLPWRDSLQFY